MRPQPNSCLDKYRLNIPGYETLPGENHGVFRIDVRSGVLRVISSGSVYQEYGELGLWEHVSISLTHRCPTWEEMCLVKDMFWAEDEMVIQYHPPKANYVNVMPYCLHLWKVPSSVVLPLPPAKCV